MWITELYNMYKQTNGYKNLAESSKHIYDRSVSLNRDILVSSPHSVMYDHFESLSDTPGLANQWLATMNVLFNFAKRYGYVTVNPCEGIEKYKLGETKAWHQADINMAKMCLTGNIRMAFFLCLYTGQRLCDIVKIRRADIGRGNDGRYVIRVRQQKTGNVVYIPVCKELKKEIEKYSPFFTAEMGRLNTALFFVHPYDTNTHVFRMRIRRELMKHGLPTQIHGLRKSAASMLAEAGCTDSQIMAITGHKTRQMVSHYTKSASQKVLAQAAIDRLDGKD